MINYDKQEYFDYWANISKIVKYIEKENITEMSQEELFEKVGVPNEKIKKFIAFRELSNLIVNHGFMDMENFDKQSENDKIVAIRYLYTKSIYEGSMPQYFYIVFSETYSLSVNQMRKYKNFIVPHFRKYFDIKYIPIYDFDTQNQTVDPTVPIIPSNNKIYLKVDPFYCPLFFWTTHKIGDVSPNKMIPTLSSIQEEYPCYHNEKYNWMILKFKENGHPLIPLNSVVDIIFGSDIKENDFIKELKSFWNEIKLDKQK